MKKSFRKSLSLFLSLLMLISVLPVSELAPKAYAISGYSAGAAAEYAKAWWNGRNTAIWSDYDLWGGDCANFVCQSLYAGGIPMTPSWYFHMRRGRNEGGYSTERTESFTTVQKMQNYLRSIGGEYIAYPSASQISMGDVMIYDWDNNGRWDHCGICTGIVNGAPQIACHYSNSLDTNWIKGAAKYAVIKLRGSTCSNNTQAYDVYIVTASSLNHRTGPSTGYSSTGYGVSNSFIIHVTRTAIDGQGRTWGYCKSKGHDGWVCLTGYTQYITHVNPYSISHSMGGWKTTKNATCTAKGEKKNICSKCGYTETSTFGPNGHNWANATCTSAKYCKTCGTQSGSALGHNWGSWKTVTASTCVKKGTEKRTCSRCSKEETRNLNLVDHKWGSWQTGKNATCTAGKTEYKECSVCKIRETREGSSLGHDFSGEWVITKGDCVNPGHKDRYCVRVNNGVLCDALIETETIQPREHEFGEWYTIEDAKCGVEGLERRDCLHTTGTDEYDACNYYETRAVEALDHIWGPWVFDKNTKTHTRVCSLDSEHTDIGNCKFNSRLSEAPSCEEPGERTFTCRICYGKYTAPTKALGHSSELAEGCVIEYGSYPQSRVTDEALLSELNSLDCEWTTYDYIDGMKFAEAEYNGERYRGVLLENFRSYSCIYYSSGLSSANSWQSNTARYGYEKGGVYWFKYEPLKWKVLDPKTNLVVCESIIDFQEFQIKSYSGGTDKYGHFISYADSDHLYYENNYEKSTIRQWLNNDFYNQAFSQLEKSRIKLTRITNEQYPVSSTEEDYSANPTTDRMYLLSYKDLEKSNVSPIAHGTDYAVALGLDEKASSVYSNSSGWFLRNAGSESYTNTFIDPYGMTYTYNQNYTSCNGVRPAMNLSRIDADIFNNSIEPTCTEPGRTSDVKCLRCDKMISEGEEIPALGHITEFSNGDVMEYGSYPQGEVTDEELVNELNTKSLNWIIDDNYLGGEMKYADVEHNGKKYRAVYFSDYRKTFTPDTFNSPIASMFKFEDDKLYQAENGYVPEKVYWFEYEPLLWTVLDKESGLVACKNVIDACNYYSGSVYQNSIGTFGVGYYTDSSYQYYANNYEKSKIRSWLNDSFFNTAFSDKQKELIKTTGITNPVIYPSKPILDVADTNDKVYLLSHADVNNPNYGFLNNASRKKSSTDYSRILGVNISEGSSPWLLRTASGLNATVTMNGFTVTDVLSDGSVHERVFISSIKGIVPAINLEREAFINSKNSVEPTCTEPGISPQVQCVRCKLILEESHEIPALGHECDNDWVLIKAPTCTEKGIETAKCVRHDDGITCDKTYTREVEMLDHDLEKTAKIPAKCLEEGNDEYYTCTQCGQFFADCEAKTVIEENSWVLPALGHDLYDFEGINDGKKGWYKVDCTTDERDCQRDGCDYSEYRYHDHHELEVINQEESTCTIGGFVEYGCVDCDFVYSEITEPLGHIEGESTIVSPTCTEDGYSYWACQREGCVGDYEDGTKGPHIEYYDYKGATGHALSPNDSGYEESEDKMELISSVANICGSGSVDTYRCTHINNGERCDYTVIIGDEKDHNMSDYIVTSEPTCEEAGYKHKECLNDGCTFVTEDEVINPIGHDYALTEIVAPTCTENGYSVYVCNNDSAHSYNGDYTPSTGHAYGEWNFDEEEKTHTRICANDNSHIETVECTLTESVTTKADCENNGEKLSTCSVCEGKFTTVIPARDHNMGRWNTVIEAECEKEGLEQRECLNTDSSDEYYSCSYIETRPIAAKGHTEGEPVTENDVDAQCQKPGSYDIVTYCTVCGKELSRSTESVEPLDHVWSGWVYDNENHTHTKTCELNGEHKETESCNFVSVTTAPGCEKDGKTVYTCTVCGGEYEEAIQAHGHNYVSDHKDEATCTEDGTEYYVCTYDPSHNYTVKIPAHGHNYVFDHKDEATCTEDGTEYYVCTYDPSHNYTVKIPAHGHNYVFDHKDEATCTEDGAEYYVCTYDEAHNYTVTIEKLDHKPGGIVIKNEIPATIDNEGSYDEVIYCERCEKELSREHKTIPMLISYTATFVVVNEDGSQTVIGKPVRFLPGTKVINAPAVPEKEGYTGEWEHYELNDENIVIKAVYTLKTTDNESELISEKESSYKNGIANITLSAFAETRNAKVKLNAKPYDIILIVDQSGSMKYKMDKDEQATDVSTESRNAKLKLVANDFVDLVADNAAELGVNHRIAIVGFGMGSEKFNDKLYSYMNTGVLTPSKTEFGIKDMSSAYKNAFVNATDKATLKSAIEKIEYEGATAADLGFEMAKGIFANDESGNEKLVIFLTDGVPTTGSTFNSDVANRAINYSYLLKNNYGAKVYSVAISALANPADESEDFNKFLHYTSSNYPYARYGNGYEVNESKSYFLATTDADELSKIFKNVFAQNVSNTISFDKVTMFDTISKYFTLTIEQEEQLRNNLKSEYGVKSEDITIIRNADETTYIAVDICPQPVYKNNTMTGYGATISFNVSANENAVKAGIYDTNTDVAGVAKDGETVAEFEIPEIEIPADRTYIEFIIGDEVYAVRDVSIGDKVIAPTTTMGAWNIPEGTVVTESGAKFYATLNADERVITWHTGSESITQKYHIGQLITAPDVTAPDGKTFTGWNTEVPYRMPSYNLEFTAEFIDHVHDYKLVRTSGTCEEGIIRQYSCSCGEIKAERNAPCAHTYTAMITRELEKSVATMTCTVCGAYTEQYITYKSQYDTTNKDKYGRPGTTKTTVIDLTLYDARNVSVQPDGTIFVEIALTTEQYNNRSKLKIYRVNEDNTTDIINFETNNKYAVLHLDHFSYYVITVEDADLSYAEVFCAINDHTDSDNDRRCDVCGEEIVSDYLPGDLNGDGLINTADRMILSRYMAKWEGYDEYFTDTRISDLNNDEVINTADRMILSRYIAKWDGYNAYFK